MDVEEPRNACLSYAVTGVVSGLTITATIATATVPRPIAALYPEYVSTEVIV